MSTPNGIYRHYNGGTYRVIISGLLESNLEEMVVYESMSASKDLPIGTVFVRPRVEFEGTVDVEGKQVPRFEKVEGKLEELLQLQKPIVFFDLETTGVDVFNDRIVEIALVRINPDGTQEEKEWMINPGVPIPEGAAAIHGITDEAVKNAPRLGDIAAELTRIFDDVDIGGYNVKHFDVPLLVEEGKRLGLSLDFSTAAYIDPLMIFKLKEPRTLPAAYAKFCGKTLEDAHEAMVDIRATIEVLAGQLLAYDDIPRTPKELSDYCFPPDPDAYDPGGKLKYVNGELTINFGKNRGKTLQSLSFEDPGYLEWILRGSFSDVVKEAVRKFFR